MASTPNILVQYMMLAQVEKHDELLTKNHQMRPPGTAPLLEVHFNVQNKKKFGGKKNKKNFKGKWANKRQRSKGFNKGKGTPKHHNNDNSQVYQRCSCLIIVQRNVA